MRIKVKELDYSKLESVPTYKHKNPKTVNPILKFLVKTLSDREMNKINFKVENIGMDEINEKEPCMILMNHSCFTDLMIAFHLFHKRNFNIVCTDDGFVGKEGLMRSLGCIPTRKFLSDMVLVKDMSYATKTLKNSILMYPEATYSFDGRCALLPNSLGKCIKFLKVPVVTCITSGAFLRDPLYNNLQLRKSDVSAKVKLLLTKEDIENKSVDEINQIIKDEFTFDAFKDQKKNKVIINEPFRADYLNRILYKCPHCGFEGKMIGRGTTLKCNECDNEYELEETGTLRNISGKDTIYDSITDWYDFQNESLKKEIENGSYSIDTDVEIYALKNMKALYHINKGHLHHDKTGFVLTGCDGRLEYVQGNKVSYSLYSDYYWYELGDMICIGNNDVRYYCIIKDGQDLASKARLAVQYLYTLKNE